MTREDLREFIRRVAEPETPEERDDAWNEILEEYDHLVSLLHSLNVPDWIITRAEPREHGIVITDEKMHGGIKC